MIKMLIADDEQIVVEGIRDSICWADYGIEVCATANNGTDALKKSQKFMPELVISDIRMPGLSGLEFVRQLKNTMPQSQIILISAYQEFEYAKEAIALGVLSYITKPFKKNQILDEVIKARDVILEEERKSEVNDKFEQEMPSIKNYFLNSIILRDDLQPEEYDKKVQLYRLNLCKRNTGVFVIRIELPEDSLTAKCSFVKDIFSSIESKLLDIFPEEYKITAFVSHVNDVVVIYGSEDISDLSVNEMEIYLDKFIHTLAEDRKYNVNIGVGRTYFDFRNLYMSYKEAMSALNYKLIYGNGSVIFINNAANGGSGIVKLVVCINKKIECFENLLSVGKDKECLEKASEIAELLRETKGVSYGYIQQVFAQLLSSIVRKSIDFNIYNDDLSKEIAELFEKIYTMKNISELSEFLSQIIERICEVAERKAREISSGTINKAVEYMKKHCHENISQTIVAEYVGLNPSYFSRYFKEEIGQSFMDYMKNLRIEKAKELLSTSNMKVYEISEALGYQSVQYFSTLFKTMVGLTPQEFKDKKQIVL